MRQARSLASAVPKAGDVLHRLGALRPYRSRLFLAVVEAGSITHGAADVGLSLPAASERLRNMEATGEVTLLNWGRRGISPTEAGETLAHHARTILQQMAQMRGDIGQYAKGLRASVRIFANTAAITEFLPERLVPWMAAHPQIDVDMKERESDRDRQKCRSWSYRNWHTVECGRDRQSDPAAVRDRPPRCRVVQGASADREQGGKVCEPSWRTFIGMADGALQDHIEGQASRLGTKMKVRVRLRSFQGICRMAGAGAGVGIIPESAARRCQRSTQIAIVQLRDEWATRRLSLCVRDESDLTPPAKALFDHLSQATR